MANEDKADFSINWGKEMLRTASGAPDVESTLSALKLSMEEHILANEIPQEKIAAGVASVYNANPKTQFDLGSLVNRTIAMMADIVPGTETRVGERVKAFLRGESLKTEAFMKGEAETAGLYQIVRGANGGIRVCSETYLADAKKAYTAKAAKKAAQ